MREALDVASRFSFWMYECNLEHGFMLKGQIIHDIMMFKRRAVLDFSALPAFFVTTVLIVQCSAAYINRATVSRSCSMVL